MTKQRTIKHRNLVAKASIVLNKHKVQPSKKKKLKHGKSKHKLTKEIYDQAPE